MKRTKKAKSEIIEVIKETPEAPSVKIVVDGPGIETVVNRETSPLKKLIPKEITEIPIRSKLKYRFIGSSLTIFGKTYSKNEVLEAYPENIPKGFIDLLVCISSIDEQEDASTKKLFTTKEDLYAIVPLEGSTLFNVVNDSTGKQLNEKALPKESAEKLRDSVNI